MTLALWPNVPGGGAEMLDPVRVDAAVDLAFGALIILAIVMIATLEFGIGIAFGFGVFSAYIVHVGWKMARFDPEWMTSVVQETVEETVGETVEEKMQATVEESVEKTVEESVEATVGEQIETVQEQVKSVEERVERRPREDQVEELIEDTIDEEQPTDEE